MLEEKKRWVAAVPKGRSEVRLTLTYPALESSRLTLFLVSGADKAEAVARVRAGDTALPAGRLRPSGDVVLVARPGRGRGMKNIADYAVIGDCRSAALVGRDGSIDWLCIPRFDSDACFAALLGDRSNGFWSMAPRGKPGRTERAYRGDSLILETIFHTATGTARLLDFMPPGMENGTVVRIVEGVLGHVDFETELCIRFD